MVLHLLLNLRMGPISQSVTLQYAKKALQLQTLQLIGPLKIIIKLAVS